MNIHEREIPRIHEIPPHTLRPRHLRPNIQPNHELRIILVSSAVTLRHGNHPRVFPAIWYVVRNLTAVWLDDPSFAKGSKVDGAAANREVVPDVDVY